jgi:hypothetical protein
MVATKVGRPRITFGPPVRFHEAARDARGFPSGATWGIVQRNEGPVAKASGIVAAVGCAGLALDGIAVLLFAGMTGPEGPDPAPKLRVAGIVAAASVGVAVTGGIMALINAAVFRQKHGKHLGEATAR